MAARWPIHSRYELTRSTCSHHVTVKKTENTLGSGGHDLTFRQPIKSFDGKFSLVAMYSKTTRLLSINSNVAQDGHRNLIRTYSSSCSQHNFLSDELNFPQTDEQTGRRAGAVTRRIMSVLDLLLGIVREAEHLGRDAKKLESGTVYIYIYIYIRDVERVSPSPRTDNCLTTRRQ
jgi:hypothetical protein